MKSKFIAAALVVSLFTFGSYLVSAAPLGTGFTYQGRLRNQGAAAEGHFDLRFQLFDAAENGQPAGPALAFDNLAVDQGGFTVTLDFGTGTFDGTSRWMEIRVREKGTGEFATLAPRQLLTAAPYALYAASGNPGPPGLTGPAGATGPQGPQGIPGSADGWSRTGNAGTAAGANFLGTTDNQPLEFKVNGRRTLRLEPITDSEAGTGIVNVIGGAEANVVGSGVRGATIAGGGAKTSTGLDPAENRVDDHFGSVGGGLGNTIQTGAYASTIGGGWRNNIYGGAQQPEAGGAVIGGGRGNWISAALSTIGGGTANTIDGVRSTIGGGFGNSIQYNAGFSTIAGGSENKIQKHALFSTIGGGEKHAIAVNAMHSTIGGGLQNTIGENAGDSTIGGGDYNTIQATAYGSTIGGGIGNTVRYGHYATIAGGRENLAGYAATSQGQYSSVGGGQANNAQGDHATVPGGQLNWAGGDLSFAAGRRAKATHLGSFVWADSNNFDYGSSADNTVRFRATSGFGITTGINGTGGDATGIYVPGGSSTWVAGSDRNSKTNVAAIEPREILEQVIALPLHTWSYKAQTNGVRHIGPMAQDFFAAFQVGDDEKGIATVDADGVALAAIQGLNAKLDERTAAVEALQHTVQELREQEVQKDARIAALERGLLELQQSVARLALEKGTAR